MSLDARLFIVDTEQKRSHASNLIRQLPLEGRIWDITIKPYQSRRSLEANKRLWALHKLASESTGHSTDELHELCRFKFLPRTIVKVGEKEQEVPGRSSKLNKKDFRDFMEQVEAFYISELGVFLGDN